MGKTAYIGLGSNWPTAADELEQALTAICALPGCRLIARSSVYLTEPQGFKEQPWFHNQVCRVDLDEEWEADNFLRELLLLEKNLGRVRSPDPALRYGPRKIDLDLLLIDGVSITTADCVLPHPRLCKRAFVLVPLREIDAGIKLQGYVPDYWLRQLRWVMLDNVIWQEEE